MQACSDTFELQWSQSIKENYQAGTAPNCLDGGTFNASWTAAGGLQAQPQPPDTWGGRHIPAWIDTILGVNGSVLFPQDSYTYNFANGSSQTLNCTSPDATIQPPLALPPPTCVLPMILSADNHTCVIPCPFPIYTYDTQIQMEWAFVGPALAGLVLCIFTCLDSLFVIYDSTGGRFGRAIKGMFGSSSQQPSSSNPGSGSPRAQPSGGSAGNRQVRASTLYVLVGSLLGLLYFILGPLQTLLYWDQVSCSTPTLSLQDASTGSLPVEPSACAAQRVAPFILQAIFNLILYAMIRVYWVISRRVQTMSDRDRKMLEAALVFYCVGLPIVTFICAIALDKISTDVFAATVQLARQSTVCQYRLTQVQEWILTFVPFITTGVGVTLMSIRIAYKLVVAKGKLGTAGILKAKTASDVALQLLIFRLMALGLITFIVLIIVIGSTSLVSSELNRFAPAYAEYVNCLITHVSCVDCGIWGDLIDVRTPKPAVLSVQFASMSCIVLLFGVFFGAQSVSRLYKEWKEGSLAPKLRRMVGGYGSKPSHKDTLRSGTKSGHDGTAIMTSFNEDFVVENNVSRGQIAPTSPPSQVRDMSAPTAAYMKE